MPKRKFTRCDVCQGPMWIDDDPDAKPGPDICGQSCLDEYERKQSRRAPAWAVED